MTYKPQTRIRALAMVIAAAVGTSSGASTAGNDADAALCATNKCAHVPATALDGTWQVLVGQVNCQTGASMGPMFPSLLTFAGNGTMVETTRNPGFAIGQREPGVGVWSRSGPGVYQAKSAAFIQFTTDPGATSPGFEAGIQTITQTIRFTSGPDQWTADATVQFSDTSGALYRQGCAIAFAQRFE